jgi:hypothetical protein
VGSDDPVTQIADKIRGARASWKRIDSGEGPAPEALWKRFDEACTRAYQPYQTHLDDQARLREEHLKAKTTLLEKLQELDRETDWERPEWHQVDGAVRKLSTEWRRVGAVPRKERKTVEKAFHDLMGRIEEHLGDERERELDRRRGLIRRVESLAEAQDLAGAIEETKRAQHEWRPTVQASRRQEQEMWEQFRAACDAVFARRDAQRQAADAERQQNLDQRKALCEELEAIVAGPPAALSEAVGHVAQLDRKWTDSGPLPRAAQRQVEERYRSARQQFDEALGQHRSAERRAEMAGLRERAQLCERLEDCLQERDPGSCQELLAEVESQWGSMATISESLERPVRERYERARAALADDAQALTQLLAAVPENLQRLEDLCLRLEVLAGVDSPPELAEARMKLQVARLSDALGGHDGPGSTAGSPDEERRDLTVQWYETGPVPPSERETLRGRFERVAAQE